MEPQPQNSSSTPIVSTIESKPESKKNTVGWIIGCSCLGCFGIIVILSALTIGGYFFAQELIPPINTNSNTVFTNYNTNKTYNISALSMTTTDMEDWLNQQGLDIKFSAYPAGDGGYVTYTADTLDARETVSMSQQNNQTKLLSISTRNTIPDATIQKAFLNTVEPTLTDWLDQELAKAVNRSQMSYSSTTVGDAMYSFSYQPMTLNDVTEIIISLNIIPAPSL
ncbi:MAG: hypothetical protein WCW27_04365 [Patescibacteria group bacterium]|jgi:hypothetical protein